MSREQQTNLTQHYQQAYLIYCQQIITYLTVLNWLKAIQTLQKAAMYNNVICSNANEKPASGIKKITPESNQQNPEFKSLKYQGKPENNKKPASDVPFTPFGELTSETGPNGTINHTVDQLGRTTASTGPDQFSISYSYDLNGNLTSQIDSRGISSTFTINELNQTTEATTGGFSINSSYDTLGNLLEQTDYRGITNQYTYDPENRQTSFTRAGMQQSATSYNLAGLPVIMSDAKGNNTVNEYNNQYFKTRTILPESQVIVFEPNAFGDIEHQNNPGPNDTTKIYDQRRRLTSQTNGAGERTTYEYDLNNNRTALIKPGGQRWQYDFDAANRLTSVTNTPEAITTSYSYDSADNLTSITDAMGKVTTFTYDQRNRKLSKTYPDGSSINYSYDQNSNLKTVNLPNGSNITYQYDNLNRQTSQNYTGSLGTASVDFNLDGNGNITGLTENIDGQTLNASIDYDNLDRMTLINDHHGNTLQFSYDKNGNRITLQDPKNAMSHYNFDDLNRLTGMVAIGTGAFGHFYNPAGLMSQIQYPNNGDIEFTYENANRINTITARQSGVNVASYNYQYDQNGNRTGIIQENLNNSEIISYSYDGADRLTQVSYPDVTISYSLDKVGNRLSETQDDGTNITTKTYSYNNRDQLTAITDTGGLDISYQYDNAGNRTQINRNGNLTTFTYTPRGRVKTISQNGTDINYTYDYLGNRIKKETSGQSILYTYDQTSLLYETNTIGNVLAKYHYGSDRILAETRNNQNSYIFHDALRTPIAITNQDGSIQNRMDYDAWGNLKSQSSTSDHPFGFTGYQEDKDTGLYYAKARYYDSFTGRFNREDPLEGNINLPPTLHRYLYAGNNPTTYIDPDGECFGPITFFICLGAGINIAVEIARASYYDENLDAKRIAVAGVTGGLSGLTGVGLFGSSARAGFAFAGALSADSVFDTAGDYVLADDPDNFDFRGEFRKNALLNATVAGLVKPLKFVINPAAKYLSKPAENQLRKLERLKGRVLKEKATLTRNAKISLNAPDLLKRSARKLGMKLNLRAGKKRLELNIINSSDLPRAREIFRNTLNNNRFLLTQSLAGSTEKLIGAGVGSVIEFLDFKTSPTDFGEDKGFMVSIEFPEDHRISELEIRNLLSGFSEEFDFEIPDFDLSSLTNDFGELPDDFELIVEEERQPGEEIVLSESSDKPGIEAK
ncbi:MAG: hypothetical protein L3J52_03985 [Proteobacteria bacterium]|nr:hypothetical protein [Pseudomonadota bacterium]